MAISSATSAAQEVLAQMRQIQSQAQTSNIEPSSIVNRSQSGHSFMDHLKSGMMEINDMQKKADAMAMDVATGKSENLHETMLAATQAEITFNLMVQIRNRALEAYQEVMRMNV